MHPDHMTPSQQSARIAQLEREAAKLRQQIAERDKAMRFIYGCTLKRSEPLPIVVCDWVNQEAAPFALGSDA